MEEKRWGALRKGQYLIGLICGITIFFLSIFNIFHVWGLSQNRVGPVNDLTLDVPRLLRTILLLLVGISQSVLFYILFKREK